MSVPDVLQRITGAFDRAGVAYMLTGSFASVYYGSPRSTQDIDFVIAATPAQLQAFIQGLPPTEYYVDADAALDAQKRQSMFNVIDMKTGWKIDLIILKARAFSQEEFSRRRRLSLEGTSLFIASVEDVILAKLEWSKLAQSRRQIEDAAGILKLRAASLDFQYLDKWLNNLELTNEWHDLQHRARISASPKTLDE